MWPQNPPPHPNPGDDDLFFGLGLRHEQGGVEEAVLCPPLSWAGGVNTSFLAEAATDRGAEPGGAGTCEPSAGARARVSCRSWRGGKGPGFGGLLSAGLPRKGKGTIKA